MFAVPLSTSSMRSAAMAIFMRDVWEERGELKGTGGALPFRLGSGMYGLLENKPEGDVDFTCLSQKVGGRGHRINWRTARSSFRYHARLQQLRRVSVGGQDFEPCAI